MFNLLVFRVLAVVVQVVVTEAAWRRAAVPTLSHNLNLNHLMKV